MTHTTAPVVGAGAARLTSGILVAGDHVEHASVQGALASGRRAAQAVLAEPTAVAAAASHQ